MSSATIAHLSDPHFGAVDADAAAAILADLHALPPDIVVVTGDITQRARSSQFRDARRFIDALPPAPRLVMPGNHDIPLFDLFTRVLNPYRLFNRYIGPDLAPRHETAAVALICVDATRPSRHKNGVLSKGQIATTAAQLTRASASFRVVATHQPLAAVEGSDLRNLARGASEALDQWIEGGADLFLGGHIHLPYCVPVGSRRNGRRAIVLQAGTSVSRRIRGGIRNSYNRITLTESSGTRRMRFERRDHDPAARRFTTFSVHEASCAADGWRVELVDTI